MIKASFIFLIIFISIFVEMIFGSFGIAAPVLGCTIFYISINYGWKCTLIIALISGIIIDVLYGRHVLYSPYTLFIIALFGTYWLHKGVLKVVKLQWIPGVVIAFIYAFPIFIATYHNYDSGFLLFLFKVLNFILTLILGALILPFIVLVFDSFSEKIGTPTYINAKKRLYNSR